MKKSLIAVAVAGAVGAPMTAAQAAEAYGFVNVGIDSVDNGDTGAGVIYAPAPNDESSIGISDTAESRFGFKGSEDLGNGLTAGYRFEFGIGTDSGLAGGAGVEDATPMTRLSNVSLSGDFGTVKLGTMWGTLYEYLGWNVYRSDGHGGAGWYYATQPLNFDTSGLRTGNSVQYTYGAGGYGSDPFTFSVQGIMAPTTTGEDEALDATVVGAQGVFGDITVNGALYQESAADSSTAEPSLTGIGVGWNAGDLYIGGNFTVTDLDQSGVDDREILQVLATLNFGGGNSGMAGFSSGDTGDNDNDLTAVFLQFAHQLSSASKFYVELEQAEVDNAGGPGVDGETTVISANLKHSF